VRVKRGTEGGSAYAVREKKKIKENKKAQVEETP
jgi:hypothetical protein